MRSNSHKQLNFTQTIELYVKFDRKQIAPTKQLRIKEAHNNTQSRRYAISGGKRRSKLPRPLTSSRATIPKLNTSAFSVSWPLIAYSGAKYPLNPKTHTFNVKVSALVHPSTIIQHIPQIKNLAKKKYLAMINTQLDIIQIECKVLYCRYRFQHMEVGYLEVQNQWKKCNQGWQSSWVIRDITQSQQHGY